MMEDNIFAIQEALLDAPCSFCNYNGPGYYQAKTHSKSCVWYHVGGHDERIKYFIKAIKRHRVQIYPEPFDVEEYYMDKGQ